MSVRLSVNFFVITVFVMLVSLVGHDAQAATITVKFQGGGTCDIYDTQANGIRLDKCVNMSGKTANDIHLFFGNPNLPTRALEFDDDFFCSVQGNCFGPDVANGGTWEGVGGSTNEALNPTIWSASDLIGKTYFLSQTVINGEWTYDGEAIDPVPLPGAFFMMLLSIGAFLAHAKLSASSRRGYTFQSIRLKL